MRTVNNSDNAKKKSAIVNAAMLCIQDSNYKDLSIRNICKIANIGIGTFYHYFPSKEDLLDAVLARFDDYLKENTIPFMSGDDPIKDLYLFTDSFAKDSVNNRSLYGGIVSSSTIPLPSTREGIESEHNRILYQLPIQIIQSGQEKGIFEKEISADKITDQLIMILRGASIEWYRRQFSFDIRDCTKELTDIFIVALSKKE